MALFLLGTHTAHAEPKKLMAVLPLSNDPSISLREANELKEMIHVGVSDILAPQRFDVLPQDRLGTQGQGCTSDSCVVEALRALQADYGVTGNISKQGDDYKLAIKLYTSQSTTILHVETLSQTNLQELQTQSSDAAKALIVRGLPSAMADGLGNIYINSVPQGAQITLNGVETPYQTPHTFWKQTSGTLALQLIKDGYEPYITKTTVPNDGSILTLTPNLQSLLGTLSISSMLENGMPCRGTTWINGNIIGSTPIDYKIIATDHEVMVGCENMKGLQHIRLGENETQTLTVTVEPFSPDDLLKAKRKHTTSLVLDGTLIGTAAISLTYATTKLLSMNENYNAALAVTDISQSDKYNTLMEAYRSDRTHMVSTAVIGTTLLTSGIFHHLMNTRRKRDRVKRIQEVQKRLDALQTYP